MEHKIIKKNAATKFQLPLMCLRAGLKLFLGIIVYSNEGAVSKFYTASSGVSSRWALSLSTS